MVPSWSLLLWAWVLWVRGFASYKKSEKNSLDHGFQKNIFGNRPPKPNPSRKPPNPSISTDATSKAPKTSKTRQKRHMRQKRQMRRERCGGGNRKSGLHLLCGFLAHGHHRRKLVLCHQRSEQLLVSRSTHSLRRGWVFGEGKGSR